MSRDQEQMLAEMVATFRPMIVQQHRVALTAAALSGLLAGARRDVAPDELARQAVIAADAALAQMGA